VLVHEKGSLTSLTIVLVPRWGGTRENDFYPWLSERIEQELGARLVVVDLVPTKEAPEPGPTIASVEKAIADDPAQTIVIAHSVGCRAALRAAETLTTPLRGLLCVAGWFTVDEPWIAIMPWLRDAKKPVAPRSQRIHVLLSDDDPFAADQEATRRDFEAIGAHVTIVPGGKHFNRSEEPDVFRALQALAEAT
jgi:uncharacterized protein